MFWDSSAIVPLAFEEPHSNEMLATLERAPVVRVWWTTSVECHAAAQRRYREKRASLSELKTGLEKVRGLTADARVITPSEVLRSKAERLLAAYPLRAADALQLAAALEACEDQPWNESFVCLDRRLRDAARKEGFAIVPADEEESGGASGRGESATAGGAANAEDDAAQ